MNKLNRRNFVKDLLLGGGALALAPSQLFAQNSSAANVRPFEILTLGDSVMWGQGLLDDDKYSHKIREWLETTKFQGKREVNLHVKAHSGATITDITEKGFEPLKYYNGEINISTPNIMQQADDAVACFNRPTTDKCFAEIPSARLNYYGGNPITPQNIDLILVNGGINDMGAGKILIPNFHINAIKNAAKAFCETAMTGLLKKLADQFPNARIIVPNYFPLVSTSSDPTEVYKAIVQAFGANPFTDYVLKVFGILKLPVFDQYHFIRNFIAKRSSTWVAESNDHLSRAVKNLNELKPFKTASGNNENRAFFVKAPFGKANAYAADKTFLWRLTENVKVDDDRFADREAICKDKKVEGLNQFERFVCRRAGLFHPNKDGADAYYEAIRAELTKIF
jgi:lysophospholipase L1-like esterase